MPKKKKKGAEKEKKARKKPWINERETVSYEQQILENNRQLARLRSRNEHLEGEVDVLKTKLNELEDDRSDVVAHLKRVLQQKTEESRELSDRLLAMEELRKDEQIAYKKKEEAMESEYHTMETNLSAEVKLAAGKLNALEDWRLARIDLMRKFEVQEEQMAEQENRHKKTLYEAEKSFIIGKAKMQKEMEDRLNDLAQSFREATNTRIADATHRAVRENIALNLELDAMYKVCRELDGRMKEYKEKERNLRLHASLFQSEAQMALNKLLEQNRFIDNLAEDHFNMSLEHGKICREEAYAESKEQVIQAYRDQSVEAQRKARILEQNIEQTRKDTEVMLNEIRDNCCEVKRLGDVLDAAKRYINKIAQLQERAPTDAVCTSCYNDFEDKLYVLMDILKQQDICSGSGAEDHSQVEGECAGGSFRSLAGESSVRIMQTGSENEAATTRNDMVQEAERNKTVEPLPDHNIVPSCLLSDSQSSDLASPKETETPRSIDSKDQQTDLRPESVFQHSLETSEFSM